MESLLALTLSIFVQSEKRSFQYEIDRTYPTTIIDSILTQIHVKLLFTQLNKFASSQLPLVYLHNKRRRRKRKKNTQNRLQNSPYFCVFKYTVRTNSSTELKTGETRFFSLASLLLRSSKPILRKKNDCFAVYTQNGIFHLRYNLSLHD